jgi:hypothetical protein
VSQKELAQHYVLEIAARARTVESRCTRLLDEEFFSDAPPAFARTIRRICDYVSKATVAIYSEIDWSLPAEEIEFDLTLLRTTDHLIKVVAEQLRYVEAARTERIPWSIVASFEKLVAAFLPDIQIMLRAMWRYNYAFHMVNQGDVYRRYLEPYREYVPGVNLESEVLKEMQRPFHIISFPSLEQKHILLHCLLGHEIGHLLVGKFLTKEREAAFLEKIKSEVTHAADEDLKTLPAGVDEDVRRTVRERTIGAYLQETLNQWRRALEELLSDATAVFLFGPAALLSILDLAIQNHLDETPEAATNYYPPWRMRLRHSLLLLDEQGGWFPVPVELFRGHADRARRVNDRVTLIRSLVGSDLDQTEINKSRLAHIAYREVGAVIAEGHAFLLETSKLAAHRPSAHAVYERLPILVERLDHQIPPNAFEQSLEDDRIASFAEIINASWLHKVSTTPFDAVTGQFDSTAVEARNLMNNLTLKAIEFAHLETEYGQWKPAT